MCLERKDLSGGFFLSGAATGRAPAIMTASSSGAQQLETMCRAAFVNFRIETGKKSGVSTARAPALRTASESLPGTMTSLIFAATSRGTVISLFSKTAALSYFASGSMCSARAAREGGLVIAERSTTHGRTRRSATEAHLLLTTTTTVIFTMATFLGRTA
eukprot:GILJ01002113.1.p2 GENE.GILJ01002113.1~~GILJ01002113.1.p2  ORF type:complete len:160 (+),score=19.61 GILJ01002113.1:172-651(+)